MNKLQWAFELFDRASAPANKIEKQLRAADEALRKLDASARLARFDKLTDPLQKQRAALQIERDVLRETDRAMRSTTDSSAFLAGAFGGLTAEAGRFAIDASFQAVEKIGEIGGSFLKAGLDAADFARTTKIAIGTVTGSTAEANRFMKEMVGLAAQLPLTTQQVFQFGTAFRVMGTGEDDLRNLLTATSDVGALNPGRKAEAMNDFVRQINDIRAVGISDRHLMYLSQEAHIPEDLIAKELGHYYKSILTPTAMKKAISAGLVNKNDFIWAVTQAVADMQGGSLGVVSNRQAHETITGLMSTLKSRPLELMMDLDMSRGYDSVTKFLNEIVAQTDPHSAFGGRLKDSIRDAFDTALDVIVPDPLTVKLTFALAAGALDTVRFAATAIWDYLKPVRDILYLFTPLPGLKGLLAFGFNHMPEDAQKRLLGVKPAPPTPLEMSLGAIKNNWPSTIFAWHPAMAGISHGGRESYPMLSAAAMTPAELEHERFMRRAFADTRFAMHDYGYASTEGFADGMLSNGSHEDAARQMARDVHAAAADELGIHSPSRVFRRLGIFTAQGFADGMSAGQEIVAQSMRSMVSPRAALGGSSHGVGFTVRVEQHFHAPVRNEHDAHALAEVVRDVLPAALGVALQRLAAEQGVA